MNEVNKGFNRVAGMPPGIAIRRLAESNPSWSHVPTPQYFIKNKNTVCVNYCFHKGLR